MSSTATAATTYQENIEVQKKRWLILIVLNLFTFMSTLDGSIVNIALPVLSRTLHLPVAQIEWVTTAYLMAICTAILFLASLEISSVKSKYSKSAQSYSFLAP